MTTLDDRPDASHRRDENQQDTGWFTDQRPRVDDTANLPVVTSPEIGRLTSDPSGIGERTLLSYEHGVRELAVLRLLELCATLDADPISVLSFALQRARTLLDNVDLRVDLRALLDNQNAAFRPMHQWARNKLNRHSDGIAKLVPVAVGELADFIGCAHNELAPYLARFVPDAEYE